MTRPIEPRTRSPRRTVTIPCLAVVWLALLCGGCASHHHRIGAGSAGIASTTQRQWFWLGYFRVNQVDVQRFTEGSPSYDIITEFGPADWLWSIVLAPLGFSTRTVVVER